MNWKLKSVLQRACASLPAGQEAVYYTLQRTLGSLRRPADPLPMLKEFARMAATIRQAGICMPGRRVMEVGTGRRLDMPLGFYLAGSAGVITFDLHRYLKPELVMQSVEAIRENREAVYACMAPVCDGQDLERRLEALCSTRTFSELIDLARIDYHAPADAAATGLPAKSVDLQFSYTVFEHIPEPVLEAILVEAGRVLAPDGAALHHIDPSDHFSHEDPLISPINFLQFSARQWDRYGANQFAYHNRLRADDFARIYQRCGHEILQWIPKIDERSLKLLANGFPLEQAFRAKSPELLCTVVLHVLSRPGHS